MKNIFKILLAGLLVASCGDVEPVTFSGQEGGPNYVSFSRSVYNLPVVRDESGSVEIMLNVSTLSSTDRTYTFELVPNTSSLAANPATYTIPGSVTVFAGQYSGTAVVTGEDNGLVDETKKNFAIRITNLMENDDTDSNLATFSIYEVCPLGAPFMGEYAVEQTSSASPNTGETIIPSGIYTLREGETEYDRYITFVPYGDANFGLSAIDVLITFGCDTANMFDEFDTGLSCDESGTPSFVFGGSEDPASYDRFNDSSFVLTFAENTESACSGSPREVNISFTKVE